MSEAPALRGTSVSTAETSAAPTTTAAIAASSSAQVAHLDMWVGTFGAEETCGKSEDGEKMFASHRVKIVKLDDHWSAEITGDGFQTATHLRARVEGTPTQVKLIMTEPLPNNVTDGMEPGDVLLEWSLDGAKLSTKWVKLAPLCDRKPQPNFVRVRSK